MAEGDYAAYRLASTYYGMSSFFIMVAYLGLVLVGSPLWRKFVPPLNIGYVVLIYNAACSLLSLLTLVLFVVPLAAGWEVSIFSIASCKSAWTALAFEVYYYTKVLELLDTLWMVLRHKSRQITVLHVFHHSTMVILGDIAYMTTLPAVAFGLSLNSAVHVVMYMYYFVAAARSLWSCPDPAASNGEPARKSFLHSSSMEWLLPRWRQRMTEMQLLQFFIGGVHNVYGYMFHKFCPYGFMFLFVLVCLFFNFYYRAYLKPRPSRKIDSGKKLE